MIWNGRFVWPRALVATSVNWYSPRDFTWPLTIPVAGSRVRPSGKTLRGECHRPLAGGRDTVHEGRRRAARHRPYGPLMLAVRAQGVIAIPGLVKIEKKKIPARKAQAGVPRVSDWHFDRSPSQARLQQGQGTGVEAAEGHGEVAAYPLQVLLSAGNPEATQAAPVWRPVGPDR